MSFINKVSDYFLGERKSGASVGKQKKALQPCGPSFSDRFSILEFDSDNNLFLLEDGVSVASGLELIDIPSELLTEENLNQIYARIVETFSSVVPNHRQSPWVMQFYFFDDVNPSFANQLIDKSLYQQEGVTDGYSKAYATHMKDLIAKMARENGLFFDPQSDGPYKIRVRRLRVLLYRRFAEGEHTLDDSISEHLSVRKKVIKKLQGVGCGVRLLHGEHYYKWFLKWFNPEGPKEHLKRCEDFPYPDPAPANFHMVQNALFSEIRSTREGFSFNKKEQRVLVLEGLRTPPDIGLLSRERKQLNANQRYALLDKLPEGSVYTIQIIFYHEDNLTKHLKSIKSNIIGGGSEGNRAKENVTRAEDEIFKGNKLYWVTQAVFFQGSDATELDYHEELIRELFIEGAKIPSIATKDDLHPQETYLALMPFNLNPTLFHNRLQYDRLVFASELGAILPVYGRFKGDGKSNSLLFFNRVGEPVRMDLLSKSFIVNNSHLSIFANSGGGKSVLIGYLVFALMATKNARIVIFEMGNSFDGLVDNASHLGKDTKQLLFSQQKDKVVPVNPFCEAYKALPEIEESYVPDLALEEATELETLRKGKSDFATDEEKGCDSDRNYIAELTLALRTMITEANEKEEEGFTLADETLLIEILCDGILKAKAKNKPQALVEDIVEAFEEREASEKNIDKKKRVSAFLDRIKSYVLNPAKKRQFNHPSEPMDEFDLLHVDISSIKDDNGKIALIMLSILPKIIGLAERTQNTNRPTFLFIDEAHLQFKIESVVSYALLIAKVARKLGLWLVPVSQNVSDMESENAKKILTLCETMIALGINNKEIDKINEFKPLCPQTRMLLGSMMSEKGKFSEAVLLGERYQGLFRVIPPRFLLSLLMTETEEKKLRNDLIQEHGCPIKGVQAMAAQLEENTYEKERLDDELFLD